MDPLLTLAFLVPFLPIIIMCIVGFVIVTRRLTQHRRARRFAQLGFGALLLRIFVAFATQVLLLPPHEPHMSASSLAGKAAVGNVVSAVLMFAGILFLTLAILADRKTGADALAPTSEQPLP
jgi:hypothetical protein